MAQVTPRKRVRGPFPSLRAFFDQTGSRQADVARDAGITESHLSNIIAGRRAPSYELALALSRLTNVPFESIGPRAA